MKTKNYYFGIDIGTDSIGYAATNPEYDLIKFKGEPVWGVTLFDEASLNTERRSFRTARRRLDRRQQRVQLIRELFAPEINKVDPGFFNRQMVSFINRDDTEEKFSVFGDEKYTDKEYYKQYPTIHHLIVELMYSDAKHDVRLVYLACAWFVAHRGHFLSEVSKDNLSALTDFNTVWNQFENWFTANGYSVPWSLSPSDTDTLGEAIKKKSGITTKYKEASKILFGAPKAPKNTEDNDAFPFNTELLIKSICAGKISLKDLFFKDEYEEAGKLSLGDKDETIADALSKLDDTDAQLIKNLKDIYDWSVLVDILSGKRTVSEAKVEIYERHKTDLALLKKIIKKYVPDKYNEVFRNAGTNNYVAYSYNYEEKKAPKQKANAEEFCTYISGIINKIEPDNSDAEAFNDMKSRLETRTFMPKQINTDNRVIPYQLYWYELNIILKNSEKHLPFLADKDETGLSVSEKILSVFTFRIPYYVGPLNDHSDKAWIRRKADGRILPWNFEEKVDLDASEDEFIRRMTNTCTYLPGEVVLPKESLLYHRFTVLNEINNIKINGVKIPVEVKQDIYNTLFKVKRKVTRKDLFGYLVSIGLLDKNDGILSGIDEQVKSNLKSYHDFRRLLESGKLSEDEAEEIILRSTCSDDKLRFKAWLNNNYKSLSEEDAAYISKLNYKDFGRLSRRFLAGLEGTSKEGTSTGEVFTITAALWNTNNNLMELLSDSFTYRDSIEYERKEYYSEHPLTLEKQLDEMYISNAVKRPIIRALEITKEVTKALGGAPEKIFIETTRSADPNKKGKRTKTRKQQILELYEKCKKEDIRILKEQLDEMGEMTDNELQSDRLFLYYMQLGKCMYTGQAIDLTLLKGSTYNIEHIYPQALVKDDSIINNEVLVVSEVNGEKSDTYPISADIRNKMSGFWSYLKKAGLISEEKYNRLTRSTPFSDDEKMGFINRQLTETSQSTKAIASLLKKYYPDTEIVYVKASLTSDFRHEFGLYKSRIFNDLHHAKDAYLNIVTGNVYNEKFTKSFNVSSTYSVKTKTLFSKDFKRGTRTIWGGAPMIEKVKKTVAKNNAHMTKYAFCRKGGLFDQMPLKKASGLIPLKKGLDPEKYGGYNKLSNTGFIITKYKTGKKAELMVLPLELMAGNEITKTLDNAEKYAKAKIASITGKEVNFVSFPLGLRVIKINTVISLDGFKVCISGSSSGGRCIIAQPFMPFSESLEWNNYFKKVEKLAEKASSNSAYIYSAEYDCVTSDKNIELYDLYVSKLKSTVFSKRPNNPIDTLTKGRDTFISLSPIDQSKALLSIHQVFGRISSGCDLTMIGGSARAAATVSFSSSISNWKKYYKDVRIVDASTAGLWEKKSQNLLELI